jgi:hypothetical protein
LESLATGHAVKWTPQEFEQPTAADLMGIKAKDVEGSADEGLEQEGGGILDREGVAAGIVVGLVRCEPESLGVQEVVENSLEPGNAGSGIEYGNADSGGHGIPIGIMEPRLEALHGP